MLQPMPLFTQRNLCCCAIRPLRRCRSRSAPRQSGFADRCSVQTAGSLAATWCRRFVWRRDCRLARPDLAARAPERSCCHCRCRCFGCRCRRDDGDDDVHYFAWLGSGSPAVGWRNPFARRKHFQTEDRSRAVGTPGQSDWCPVTTRQPSSESWAAAAPQNPLAPRRDCRTASPGRVAGIVT